MDPPAGFPRLRAWGRYPRVMEFEEEESLCVICFNEVLKLITAECGHTICMSCFRKKTSPSSCCAACWEFSQLRTLQDDMVTYPEGEGMCEIHREYQKLFCDNSKTLLCVTCSKSEYHDNHIHWPIAVAALRYRKKIQIKMETLCRKLQIVEEFLLKEERPLVWAVVWTDYKNKDRNIFHKEFQQIWECLMRNEKIKVEEPILWKENCQFIELYQRLKEMEVTQEQRILEEKEEWEAMISSQSRFIAEIITELEDKMEKPDVEMLQDVAETLQRSSFRPNLEPFILNVDASYVAVVTEFLKLFERHKLSERCYFYNLSDEKKRAIRIVSDFSGKPYLVYVFGSVQAEDIRRRTFITQTFSGNEIVEDEDYARTFTTFRNDM